VTPHPDQYVGALGNNLVEDGSLAACQPRRRISSVSANYGCPFSVGCATMQELLNRDGRSAA
jgi:hypothetical protein